MGEKMYHFLPHPFNNLNKVPLDTLLIPKKKKVVDIQWKIK